MQSLARSAPPRAWKAAIPIRKSKSKKTASIAADLLIFMIGALTSFSVRLVGSLPIAEFLLIPLFPIILAIRGRRFLGQGRNPVYFLILMWFCSQVATDIYRGSPRESWMRGLASIVFFSMDLIVMTILAKGNVLRQVLFLVGSAIGTILAAKIQPSDLVLAYPWKFGYSAPVSLFVLAAACLFYKRGSYFPVVILVAGLIALNLAFNFRSSVLFLIVLAALILPIVPEQIGQLRILPRGKNTQRVLALAGLALAAGYLSLSLIHIVARYGLAGEEAQAKNLHQFNSKQGLLLSGRPEILVSSQAVLDSPIIGHGSGAKDPKYIEMLYDIEVRNGGGIDLEDMEVQTRGEIPTHSHFMGAWVQGGVLGAVFWGYIFWLAFKALVQISLGRPSVAPLYAWVVIHILWNIPFSPFGGVVRLNAALTITIILDILQQSAVNEVIKTRFKRIGWQRKPYGGSCFHGTASSSRGIGQVPSQLPEMS